MKRFWLSFATETEFRGVVIVEAESFLAAVTKAHILKVNPGGQVFGPEVPQDYMIQPEAMNRLLTKADLECLFGDVCSLKELEAEGTA